MDLYIIAILSRLKAAPTGAFYMYFARKPKVEYLIYNSTRDYISGSSQYYIHGFTERRLGPGALMPFLHLCMIAYNPPSIPHRWLHV